MKRGGGVDVFWDALLVKPQHRLVAPQAAGAAEFLFDRLDFRAHFEHVIEKLATLAQAVADDAFPQENCSSRLRIDAAVVNPPPCDDGQAAADHGFLAVDRALGFVPVRLAILALAEVRRDLLDPRRINSSNPPRPQPRGFDELHAHHPLEALGQGKQAGAGEYGEETAVRAAVGFRLAVPHAELPRHACEKGLVERGVVRRAG